MFDFGKWKRELRARRQMRIIEKIYSKIKDVADEITYVGELDATFRGQGVIGDLYKQRLAYLTDPERLTESYSRLLKKVSKLNQQQ